MSAEVGAVDWTAIKTDYVCGGGSYRSLAYKYGISKDMIARRCCRENWQRQRDKTCDTIARRTLEKAVEKISEERANAYGDQAAARARIKSKLLAMAEDWIDAQKGKIHDMQDYRRIVQCCMDMLVAADSADEKKISIIMDAAAEEMAE